jgi:hypothetical protein
MARDKKIKKASDFDLRYRSLLQKAVRRGNVDLVFTVSALIESLGPKQKLWFASQAAIITFEECWPLGAELAFNKRFHSKAAAIISVTRAMKSRDAAGLGNLAHALWEGDQTVISGSSDDKHIKILANAIERPKDFWKWIVSQKTTDRQYALIKNAIKYRKAGSPRDRAVLQAAAYLVVSDDFPEITLLDPSDQKFPYWIVFDRHTPEGHRVLRDISRDLHIPLPQLEWSIFYFEGAKANAETRSNWWRRHSQWYFQKIGLPVEEAHLLWDPAKPQVMEDLKEESRQLQNSLYKWKISNLERIDALKNQVALFNEHIDKVKRDQCDLF